MRGCLNWKEFVDGSTDNSHQKDKKRIAKES